MKFIYLILLIFFLASVVNFFFIKLDFKKSLNSYINAVNSLRNLSNVNFNSQKLFNDVSIAGIKLLFKLILILTPFVTLYKYLIKIDISNFTALILSSIIYLPLFKKRKKFF